MVFDAHERAFAFFKGACQRGIYDNMKTAVETIFIGKERQYNRRFLQMCSHHLVEPVACTPASGWEKGQVENQVGLVRERFFTPRLRFKSYDELNAWLLDKCLAWAKAHAASRAARPHDMGDVRGRTAEADRLSRSLRRVPQHAGVGVEDVPRALRQQPLLGQRQRRRPPGRDARLRRPSRHPPGRADRRRAPAQVRPRPDGVRRLALRAGAGAQAWRLRNGAPFKDWVLPASLERVRRKLSGSDEGDRQMVKVLAAVLTDGLAGGRGGLRAGAGRGRPFRRRHSQHSRPPPRSASAGGGHRDARVAGAAPCAGRQLRPLRQPRGASDGTDRSARHDGRAEALWHEGGLRRDADRRAEAPA